MSELGDLFGSGGETPAGDPPPRRRCSTANRKPYNRNRVYDFLFFRGDWGATDEEAFKQLDMPPQSYVPRRVELVRLGLVRATRERRTTDTGCSATVWVASAYWDPTRDTEPEDFGGGVA